MVTSVTKQDLKDLYLPPKDSHKGQNGRLLIIGGSRLFHAASLWALKVASRIVDLVHYSSVPENNRIVQKLKEEFRDGIIVPRTEIEDYIKEDDCVLIGPGMVRAEISNLKSQISKLQFKTQNLRGILNLPDEGLQTYFLTKYLLQKYPHKKWVIDAGALQMMEPSWIPKEAILTPHRGEFERLFGITLPKLEVGSGELDKEMRSEKTSFSSPTSTSHLSPLTSHLEIVSQKAKQFNCIILLKGEIDIVASKDQVKIVEGGNAGMTKGGTGDVLAGLVAAFYCKNEAFTSAVTASYINKKAGEDLYKKMGYWFNASDLADQIPRTMKRLLL